MIRIAAVPLVFLATVFVPACSGNSSSSPATSGSDYCSEVRSYASRCNLTDACTVASLPQCSASAAAYSSAELAAATACFSAIACGDAGAAAGSSCLQKKVAAATPTTVQTKLAQDYCAACPSFTQTTAQCLSSFYGGTGPATELIAFNDTIATDVDAQCIPASADGGPPTCDDFGQCVIKVLVADLPPEPAACTGGVTYDGG